MNDFLNNPEERIAEFSGSLENKIKNKIAKREKVDSVNKNTNLKKEDKKKDIVEENKSEDTVQVRISRSVDIQIREINWNTFILTGKKTSMRELLDCALLEYIDNCKKKNHK